MSDPINYFNPISEKIAAEKPVRVDPLTAVPEAFDYQLTVTADHAAARAIVTALVRLDIDVFQGNDGNVLNRQLTLHIRGADREAAAPVAAEIFARRQKVKTLLPKKKPEPDTPAKWGNSLPFG